MTGNRNLSVGVFVSAALLAGIVLTIWITGMKGSEPKSSYSVLVEGNVSGLSLGGPVYFLGVKVGEVTNLEIVPGDPARIQVDINIAASAPVNQGTWATLAPQGITGVSVINLANDTGQHGPLSAGAAQTFPLIPYRDSGFSALLSNAPVVMEKMDRLLEQANRLISDENQRLVTQTLANVESLSRTLKDQEQALAALPSSITESLQDINALSAQLSDLLAQAAPDVLTSLQHIERSSEQLAQTIARLDAWTNEHDQEIRDFMTEGLGQVPELIEQSEESVRALEKLLEQLRADPSSLILERPQNEVEWE